MSTPSLNGLRVFLVEDESAVLLMLEDVLEMYGCEIAATASRIMPALAAAQTGVFDAAVLDVNVADELIFPVAEVLVRRNVPIVFSTGYGISGVAEGWRCWPVLQKPYRPPELANALLKAMGMRAAEAGPAA